MAGAAIVVLLAACAQAAPRTDGQRVLLQTAADWPDATQAAARAAQLAGVPALEARSLGPRRFVMTLACGDATGCERALARLRAEPGFTQSVEIDSRDRLPARPGSSSAY